MSIVTVGLAGAAVVAWATLRNSDDGLRFVALGDSYSAGVGLGEVTKPDCDRDGGAYGPLAADLVAGVDFVEVEHIACSGAVVADLEGAQLIRITRADDVVVPPQLDALSSSTDVVTMTIGGNDIDFAGKVVGCLVGECGPAMLNIEPSSSSDPDLTWDLLAERLSAAYRVIRDAMDEDGFLFVLSYPVPFRIEGGRTPCAGFDAIEMKAANALSTMLGDVIARAVADANSRLAAEGMPGHVVFVDWRTGTRVADGYTAPDGDVFDYVDEPNGICSTTPLLNGFDPLTLLSGNATNNFHPTTAGYEVAAREVAESIETALASQAG